MNQAFQKALFAGSFLRKQTFEIFIRCDLENSKLLISFFAWNNLYFIAMGTVKQKKVKGLGV